MDGFARELLEEVVRAASALGPLWALAALVLVAVLVVVAKRIRLTPTDPPPSRYDDVAPAEPPSEWGDNVQQNKDPSSSDTGGG